MDEQKKLRVGVLGLGVISQAAHIEAARRAKNTELVAVCDVAEDLCQRISASAHVPKYYTDYDEMLKDKDIDAVILGVAHEYHVPCALKAVAAGKHVLSEKPLGVSIAQCEELRAALKKTGLVFQVGNMKRFDVGISFAKDFVDSGELGEVVSLDAWYCDNYTRRETCDTLFPIFERSGAVKPSPYKTQHELATIKLLDHCSHLLDTARFLAGPIESLRAQHRRVSDMFSWQIGVTYESGAIGNLNVTLPVRMDWNEGFFLYGTSGSITAKTEDPWYFRPSRVEAYSEKSGVFKMPLGVDGHFYKLQLEAFADTILNGAAQRGANIDDGVAAIRGICAIEQSARTGERVKLCEAEDKLL